MISRNEFDAYNLAVDKIGNKAASDVESSVLNWCRQNPDASVAEKREAAKLIMEGYVQGYDDVASGFAAEWYDHRAKSEGISLDQAITMAVYSPEKSDAVARYQARKLAKGGDAAFAKACGEYARNDALRSLNETIIANVGRDKDKGAKFARVPTGFETCTFCLMLASRGAVYYSRKTAGEWRHFHRNCDCKVVPGFEKDPLAVLVEGHNPREAYEVWKKLKAIDETVDASGFVKNALKNRVVGRNGVINKESGAHPWKKEFKTAELVSMFGINVLFLKEKPPSKTPDAYLDDELFEFKIPEGFNEKTVKNQLKNSAGKGTGNLLISNVACDASDIEMMNAIDEFIKDERYVGEFLDITRILFVGKQGSLREYKR